MQEFNLGLDDIETIDIKLNDGHNPRTVNFGSGAELLMNDKKRSSSSSSNIDLGELDKLEEELNELSGNKN